MAIRDVSDDAKGASGVNTNGEVAGEKQLQRSSCFVDDTAAARARYGEQCESLFADLRNIVSVSSTKGEAETNGD